jgi:hypothetical protein
MHEASDVPPCSIHRVCCPDRPPRAGKVEARWLNRLLQNVSFFEMRNESSSIFPRNFNSNRIPQGLPPPSKPFRSTATIACFGIPHFIQHFIHLNHGRAHTCCAAVRSSCLLALPRISCITART